MEAGQQRQPILLPDIAQQLQGRIGIALPLQQPGKQQGPGQLHQPARRLVEQLRGGTVEILLSGHLEREIEGGDRVARRQIGHPTGQRPQGIEPAFGDLQHQNTAQQRRIVRIGGQRLDHIVGGGAEVGLAIGVLAGQIAAGGGRGGGVSRPRGHRMPGQNGAADEEGTGQTGKTAGRQRACHDRFSTHRPDGNAAAVRRPRRPSTCWDSWARRHLPERPS